MISAIIKN